MNCEKCQQLLNAYLDGELEGIEFDEVEVHIDKCPECRSELDQLVKMRELLMDLRSVEVPEGEKEAFIEALRARLKAEGAREPQARRMDLRPLLIAAIVVIVFLMVFISGHRREPNLKIAPASGLNAMENAVVDGVVAGVLDDHIVATSGDFMTDPGVTSGEVVALWRVVKGTHSDLFRPAE